MILPDFVFNPKEEGFLVVTDPKETLTQKAALLVQQIVDPNQFKQFKKKFAFVIFQPDYTSNYEKTTRHMLEQGWCDVVVDLEKIPEKDFMHQKNTLFNHVHAKLCAKNNIAVGFSFHTIEPTHFPRIKQILKLCKKYKVQTQIFSFATSQFEKRSTVDMNSLLELLSRRNYLTSYEKVFKDSS